MLPPWGGARQDDGESAPLSNLALHLDAPAMDLNEFPGDGQPYSYPLLLILVPINLVTNIKDPGDFGRRYAYTLILN